MFALRRFACMGLVLGALLCSAAAHGAEKVTLRNGFSLECDHLEAAGSVTRLFLQPGSSSYVDVSSAEITSAQALPPNTSPASPDNAPAAASMRPGPGDRLSPQDLQKVLAGAGHTYDLNVDLLLSVVHAESSGRVHAVSRAGAEGLMQLMPSTASSLGVADRFAVEQNVGGGTAYLNALLHRYRDNLALALAAYNAGPAAVDRWHGVPPFPETRAYVARIIHEFNARYAARQAATGAGQSAALASGTPALLP